MDYTDLLPQIEDVMRLQAECSMMAWAALAGAVDDRPDLFTEKQAEFITGMREQSVKFHENISEFINDIINDPTCLPLAQASMGELITKWGNK